MEASVERRDTATSVCAQPPSGARTVNVSETIIKVQFNLPEGLKIQ